MIKPVLIASTVALLAGSTAWAGGSSPTFEPAGEAGPGQCMGQVLLPPSFETVRRRVLESGAGMERERIPAVVDHSWRKVMISPARRERITTRAVYRTEYTSAVQAGPRRWEHTSARYAVYTERVLAEPGRWVWERRYGPVVSAGPPRPGQTLVQPTGEIMCKVWRRARYQEIAHRVLVSRGVSYSVPTRTRRWIAHRVLVRPAGMWIHDIPAQYREVDVSRTLRPEQTRWVPTTARYGEVQTRQIRTGGEGWVPVVCGGPLSRQAMQRLQSSLLERGYDPGPADGYGRAQTYSALRRFQMDNHMAAGQVTVESARALGVVR